MSLDFKGMEDEIRKVPMQDYAPRRVVPLVDHPPPPGAADREAALTDEIKSNAERMAILVGNVQEREKRAVQKVAELEARLEQRDNRITELESKLETAELELKQEHTERVRLRSVFESVGGLVADALHFKHG